MTPDDLRAIREFLAQRVRLRAAEPVEIAFDAPTADEMIAAGLDAEGCRQVLEAPWWDEMVADIVETPQMCEADEGPEQVLSYARDVVDEYMRKRMAL